MSEHPIQGLMSTAMSNIKDMVDVNTIIGDPISAPDGTVIIPVSKVSFGFVSGGSDYPKQPANSEAFGGGSGAGITINPIAFLIVGGSNVKLLQISENAGVVDKVLEMVPDIVDKITASFKSRNKDSGDVSVEL